MLIKVKEAKSQTRGGIVLPDQSKAKATEGIVVATGPGRIHPETQVLVPMPVVMGQRVLHGKFEITNVILLFFYFFTVHFSFHFIG